MPSGVGSPGPRGTSAASKEALVPCEHGCDLGHVEIVPPCGDLPVRDVEGTHDGQGGRLAVHRERVGPLGQHGRAVTGQVVDLELHGLAHADEHVDHTHGGFDSFGGIHRDVVVHDLVGEEAAQDLWVTLACGGAEFS